eukprot:scaffold2380_cov100-Skeletonema_marinoi.AAC.1
MHPGRHLNRATISTSRDTMSHLYILPIIYRSDLKSNQKPKIVDTHNGENRGCYNFTDQALAEQHLSS